ncbi:MAG: glycine zipper 2TM domain-containing protein [Burkholderiales bacterium]|nr:glycine zipper 2TM domain-containing protein [Burkholderiales bacterium]
MLIAAVAVILFSVIGIATMTGLIPSAQSTATLVTAEPTAGGNTPAAAPASVSAGQPARTRRVATADATPAVTCDNCGVIDSIRPIEVGGQGSGLGAVSGAVIGGVLGNQIGGGRGRTAVTVVGAGAGAYAGHEIEKNVNSSVSYQIRVRMQDGTYRTFRETTQSAWSVGQRVRVTERGIIADG